MSPPNLSEIVPKTITSIGKFNGSLNLSQIFDVVPLHETDDFRLERIKYEGLVRDMENGGIPVESGTEFKNSITMDILDKDCGKTRAVKINCEGIHMCGNRSIERSQKICDFVSKLISETHHFIKKSARGTWNDILENPHYGKMEKMIKSILPENPTDESIQELLRVFKTVSDGGGLYKLRCIQDGENLSIENLRTVMVNYGYHPFGRLRDKGIDKEKFLTDIVNKVLTLDPNKLEFDVRLDYDSHISSIGWSGSVPLKFVHRSGQIQWVTLQLRRGTIVHSGPNVEIMQKAVNLLYEILDQAVIR